MTAERAHIVIVRARQAGLASAYAAQRAGMEPIMLQAAAEPAGSWPRYYESLELFSPARYSALPGRPHRPALPGEESFGRTVVHTSEYGRPDGYAGGRSDVHPLHRRWRAMGGRPD